MVPIAISLMPPGAAERLAGPSTEALGSVDIPMKAGGAGSAAAFRGSPLSLGQGH